MLHKKTQCQFDRANDKKFENSIGVISGTWGQAVPAGKSCEGKTADALLGDTRTDEGHVRNESEDHRDGDDIRPRDHRMMPQCSSTGRREANEAGNLRPVLGPSMSRQHCRGAPASLNDHLSAGRHQLRLARDCDEDEDSTPMITRARASRLNPKNVPSPEIRSEKSSRAGWWGPLRERRAGGDAMTMRKDREGLTQCQRGLDAVRRAGA